ncbi:MAG: Ppx/GppA family phosphatase [Rhodothermales bacterium]|nr:Ppx/GppA family phosphatase [Rhodothermales bacterium]
MPVVHRHNPSFPLRLSGHGSRSRRAGGRICITDLGTNSFHSVVVRSRSGTIEIIDRLKQPVALGTEGFAKGFLSEDAMERAVEAMRIVKQFGLDNNARGHLALATSAIREASNGQKLIRHIKDASGIEVVAITGEEEAYLIYRGVTASLHFSQPVVLVDIGGGSTEITIADTHGRRSSVSLPLGAARLTEQFVSHDPITVAELQALQAHFEKLLRPTIDDVLTLNIHTLIGSSGTIENLARIASRMPLEVIVDKEFAVSAYEVEAVAREFLFSDRISRASIERLSAKRIDQIVSGAALIAFLIDRMRIARLRISPFALREGVMVEFASKEPDNQL